MRKALWALLLSLVFVSSYGQDSLLDPVTVTSSLVEKRSSETGRNITIIDGRRFAGLPVHSVDELLKYVPGIEIQSRGPQGSQSDISIRGGTYQQVLVILDGLRLNDPNTGHFTGYIPIAPAEIDRIEVLKGASSAIYGADAVGGVIHIITKTFNARKKANQLGVSGQVAGGEYGLVNINAGGFFKNDNVALGAGVLSNNATGVLQRGTRGYFHNTAVSAGLFVPVDENWDLSYRVAYDNRDFSAQNFYTTFTSDTAKEQVTSWWHQARVAYHKNTSSVSVNLGYKVLDDYYKFNPGLAHNFNTSQLYQALAIYTEQLHPHTQMNVGFNWQQKLIHSNDRGVHDINVVAPFVNFVQKIGVVSLQPSLRAEWIGSNTVEWLPQLTASARLNSIQLRASGGKTIRDADFTERYNNYNKTLVGSGSIGNPWLVAERGWNWEAGADWFLLPQLKWSTSVFQQYEKNLIDWVTTPYADMPRKDNLKPTGTYALAKNIASVTTTGVESDLQWSQDFSDMQKLLLTGGIIWMDTKSPAATTSFYVNSHAKFIGNFSFIYNIGPFNISATGIYKNRKPQTASAINAALSKDYFLLNGRAGMDFLKHRLGVFVQVDNVFDRKYSDLLGSAMPGRWLQCGVKFNWERR